MIYNKSNMVRSKYLDAMTVYDFCYWERSLRDAALSGADTACYADTCLSYIHGKAHTADILRLVEYIQMVEGATEGN